MRFLRAIDRGLAAIAGWFLVTALSAMVIMSFGQLVLRNIFGTSIEWGDVFLRHLVLWLGFLGAMLATGEDRHIKVDFFTKFIPEKAQKILSVFTSLFAAFVCYLLLSAGWSFLKSEMEYPTMLVNRIPTWYFMTIIPVGYGLMAFRFIVLALERVAEIVRGNWSLKASA
ncbi:MAG: TRAP transporter small permease [Ignavibacteriales bacterium]|nr:TRAP transporter small permease [Ignavibacteriales bacterium]